MGIFGGKRARAADNDSWHPENGQILVRPGFEMMDDGWAGGDAHGVRFRIGLAPAAAISIWCYAVDAPADMAGHFQVAYRAEYCVGTHVEGAGYDEHPEFYGDLDTCYASVLDSARMLARFQVGNDNDWGDLPSQLFDWDGEPLPEAS